jgi:hypothetical protein
MRHLSGSWRPRGSSLLPVEVGAVAIVRPAVTAKKMVSHTLPASHHQHKANLEAVPIAGLAAEVN